jgi:16S rRNA (guanine1207-N2)-methyltransferase
VSPKRPASDDPDPYFHREITLRAGDRRLSLRASQELFSSHTIDTGTLQLIKSLPAADELHVGRALDLGCGYGPVALALRSLQPDAEVVAVDRDSLAVDYTAANAGKNGLDPVATGGSLGFDDLEGRFDLIASNVPGKASPRFHDDLITTMLARLTPDGLAAIVVVNPLVPLVEAHEPSIVRTESGREHTVFHLRRQDDGPADPGPAFERGVYDRGEMELAVGRRRVTPATVHGLPEFDALGFHTQAAMRLLERHVRQVGDAVVLNPGQGHLALALAGASSIRLVDRDLLALRTTTRNLGRVGVEPAGLIHGWLPAPTAVDLAVMSLRAKEPVAVHVRQATQLAGGLRSNGALVAAGSTHVVDRLRTALSRGDTGLRVRGEERRRGFAAIFLRPG